MKWCDEAGLAIFKKWQNRYQKKGISSGIAYDSRDIFMRTDFPKSVDLSFELHQNIRQAEFTRMLDRARNMSGGELKDDVKEELKARLDALQRQFGGKHTGALNIY